jgi:hypothetical protein
VADAVADAVLLGAAVMSWLSAGISSAGPSHRSRARSTATTNTVRNKVHFLRI